MAKYHKRPAVEFYDLMSDPREQINMAEDPEHMPEMEKMSMMLDQWMKSQGDTQEIFRKPYPVTGPKPVDVPRANGRG